MGRVILGDNGLVVEKAVRAIMIIGDRMTDDMYREIEPYTYADWYADSHSVRPTSMPANMEKKIDHAVEEFIAGEAKQLSTMQVVRFRDLVWQETLELFEATSRRSQRRLNTFRPAIRNILKSLDGLEDQLNAAPDLLQGRPKRDDPYTQMCINDGVPWSERDVSQYPLLPFAVTFRALRDFIKAQCPPEDPSRGGRSSIDAEAKFYAGITKAFETVNLPPVVKRREHDGGSDFLRDRLCCKVEQLVTGGAPSTAKNRARRARKMGLIKE